MRGLSLVAASGGHSSSWCAGLSLSWPLLLQSTGSRHAGSVIVAHGPSRSTACGILPDQGLNPCPLHWQADSQPLRHQGSPPSLLDLVFLVGFYLAHLSATYFFVFSFCTASCVCGLFAGCKIVVLLASAVCSLVSEVGPEASAIIPLIGA